jgi:hypothetical protein
MTKLKIKASRCNRLWQLEEMKEFESFNDAWDFVKDGAEDNFIKLHAYIKQETMMQYVSKFFKDPDSKDFILTGNGWEETQVLSDIKGVHDAISDLLTSHS